MNGILTRFSREIFEFNDETLLIVLSVIVLVATIIVVYWLYNRRKLQELGHQIPAAVLKSYLDSIIQNSTALKSSLFRGGGLEIGEGIPSVVPSSDLPSSTSLSVGGASTEELNQKIAEIAELTKRLENKDSLITDLETKLQAVPASEGSADNSEEVVALNSEIVELKAKITELEASIGSAADSGGDGDAKLAEVTKERDELKERLLEYEIIEEDLANLKRLQQENEQLKNEMAALKESGAAAASAQEEAAPEPEPTPEPVEEKVPDEIAPAEEIPSEVAGSDADLEAEMAAAISETPAPEAPADSEPAPAASEETEGVPSNDGEQKSATELLSEFEKMLG